ncbi:hypothetical protein E3N88_02179 [Mikania micrantha]|uniref:Glabrous enhancer-binding protein-like DBD domain-containing protein n=1 Tax=Mikania micrantha TaxID=192012 RepID=A0A5N6Q3K9_9ASTR|nr:hypothetical protein E3N88_02179 [Mikania micrantha]
MDFTPTPPSNPSVPIQANPISSIPSSTKLPIKRKTPNSTLILQPTVPFAGDDDDATAGAGHHIIAKQTPFKFHRIWTELDEIRLLQGLVDCSSQGLLFPRDLGLFYAQFSDGMSMSQPYSKSQLSEKLRRLRKKFRVISSRISKGLDIAMLSPQDRALYDLSKQLWDPERPCLSFGGSSLNCKPIDDSNRKSNLPSSSTAVLALPSVIKKTNNRDNGNRINMFDSAGGGGFKDEFNVNDAGDVKVNDGANVKLVSSEVREKNLGDDLSSAIVHFATNTLADVVDRSLKEMKMVIDRQRYMNLEKDVSFEKRWRDQHVAEFDVLAKRLKLILEHSSMVGK